MKYFHRIIEPELTHLLGNFPAIMLIGPRQVGKSTLLNHLARHHDIHPFYVTLDDPVLAGEANAHPEQFLSSFPRPLIIDEFQYAPNLTHYIKMEIDQARQAALFDHAPDPGTLFFLTGSQVFNMMDQASESLAGRLGLLNLYGLSTREIEQVPGSPFTPDFQELKNRRPTRHLGELEFYQRLLRGSYPELCARPDLSSRPYFAAYLQTYIERDIRRQVRTENEYNFTRFVSLLAARTGQQLVTGHLANEIGVDNKTITGWLSLLQSTGLILLLPPYFNNLTKRVSKRPKVYFTDTGLASYLAGYPTVEGLMASTYKGQIIETHVVMELVKSFTNAGLDIRPDLYYYRSGDQAECDLLLRLHDTYYPIEIKATDRPSSADTRWIRSLDRLGLKLGNGLVICRSSFTMPLDDGNFAIPVEYL